MDTSSILSLLDTIAPLSKRQSISVSSKYDLLIESFFLLGDLAITLKSMLLDLLFSFYSSLFFLVSCFLTKFIVNLLFVLIGIISFLSNYSKKLLVFINGDYFI